MELDYQSFIKMCVPVNISLGLSAISTLKSIFPLSPFSFLRVCLNILYGGVWLLIISLLVEEKWHIVSWMCVIPGLISLLISFLYSVYTYYIYIINIDRRKK